MQLVTTVASVTGVALVVTPGVDAIPVAAPVAVASLVVTPAVVTLVVDVAPVVTLVVDVIPVAACLLTKEKSGLFLANGSNCVSRGSDRVLATHCVSVYLMEYSYPSVQILYSLCSLALLSLNYY
jgi:hypothetical protein